MPETAISHWKLPLRAIAPTACQQCAIAARRSPQRNHRRNATIKGRATHVIMTHPVRKLAGTIALLVLLVVYSVLVMLFATTRLPEIGGVATAIFYAAAGLAWVPLAMAIVSWMYRRG